MFSFGHCPNYVGVVDGCFMIMMMKIMMIIIMMAMMMMIMMMVMMMICWEGRGWVYPSLERVPCQHCCLCIFISLSIGSSSSSSSSASSSPFNYLPSRAKWWNHKLWFENWVLAKMAALLLLLYSYIAIWFYIHTIKIQFMRFDEDKKVINIQKSKEWEHSKVSYVWTNITWDQGELFDWLYLYLYLDLDLDLDLGKTPRKKSAVQMEFCQIALCGNYFRRKLVIFLKQRFWLWELIFWQWLWSNFVLRCSWFTQWRLGVSLIFQIKPSPLLHIWYSSNWIDLHC